jgi:uncharacterized protein with PIN domain
VVKKTRFTVDAMLGSLARWLRFLGYDTLYCETQSDNEILERVADRILLTQDKELILRAKNRGICALNPGSGSKKTMLQKLEQMLDIQFVANPDRSRCPQCNSELQKKSRNQVLDRVPPKSLQKHATFWQCVNALCQQVYWQGRHWTRIQNTLRHLRAQHTKE